jgi:hypothetical protein
LTRHEQVLLGIALTDKATELMARADACEADDPDKHASVIRTLRADAAALDYLSDALLVTDEVQFWSECGWPPGTED